ncbi:hypothetical protein [Brevundimonas diminuta]|uniref:hypothetical protein n=1 Tax=Brevundimonas diminuta TaxID=293 RepID=UPI0015C62930|nr:hypothetical protein [Brevundimonas diminuta]
MRLIAAPPLASDPATIIHHIVEVDLKLDGVRRNEGRNRLVYRATCRNKVM